MNKKALMGIILVIIGALFVVVGIIIPNSNDSKEIEFTKTTNGGVPYEWTYEIENPTVVEFVKSYVLEDKNQNGLVGAPISFNYVFRGLEEGRTTITFKYVSLANGEVVKEEKSTVRVDKNKNITLVGIPD